MGVRAVPGDESGVSDGVVISLGPLSSLSVQLLSMGALDWRALAPAAVTLSCSTSAPALDGTSASCVPARSGHGAKLSP